MTGPAEPAEPPKALPPGVFPPEGAELDGFRLRRPTLADDVALHAAVLASFAELHPWMPWCTEPVEMADQRAFLERTAQQWEDQATFTWFLVDAEDAMIGSISVMDRVGPGGVEIGYWLRSDVTGRGVMTRAAAWVTDTARALEGVDRVEIHCDAANTRSAAVPQRLGYRLDREQPAEPRSPGDTGITQIWITP